MKVIVIKCTLALVLLLVTDCGALRLKKLDKLKEIKEKESKAENREDKLQTSNDKEVHKRGVFYGGLGGLSSGWPKTYASHYGYNFNLPGAASFGSFSTPPHGAILKYPTAFGGFHYKALAAPLPAAPALPAFPSTAFAAATPAFLPHAQVHSQAHAHVPSYLIRPGGASISSYNVNFGHPHHHKHVIGVAHPLQPVQPVQPVQPIHTTFFQPAQAATPILPALPTFPEIPAFPAVPAPPALPSIPTFPVAAAPPPAAPPVPAIPFNPFFPIEFQPPRPQAPPTFISIPIQPAPVPGRIPIPSPPSTPETGSAEASPQIPAAPSVPEPELPTAPPRPTQQPWTPIVYGAPPAPSPATLPSDFNRPSITLLPPYGNSPAEGYLPPSPSAALQQSSNGNIFDNLTNAEIEQIFAQATLAAQNGQVHYHQRPQHRHY